MGGAVPGAGTGREGVAEVRRGSVGLCPVAGFEVWRSLASFAEPSAGVSGGGNAQAPCSQPALGTVPGERLLVTLEKTGINRRTGRWVRNWRRQRVALKGERPGWRQATGEAPLGPTLFRVFITDLGPKCGNGLIKFADGTQWGGIGGAGEDRSIAQDELDNLVKWSKRNRLRLNRGKSCI